MLVKMKSKLPLRTNEFKVTSILKKDGPFPELEISHQVSAMRNFMAKYRQIFSKVHFLKKFYVYLSFESFKWVSATHIYEVKYSTSKRVALLSIHPTEGIPFHGIASLAALIAWHKRTFRHSSKDAEREKKPADVLS